MDEKERELQERRREGFRLLKSEAEALFNDLADSVKVHVFPLR